VFWAFNAPTKRKEIEKRNSEIFIGCFL